MLQCLNIAFSIVLIYFMFVDGRVSFYAFADNKIFQVSQTNSSKAEDDVISYDATIQSKIILSASIQGPDQNLTKNVTIIFEYNQVKLIKHFSRRQNLNLL